jgi:hypothetical protein
MSSLDKQSSLFETASKIEHIFNPDHQPAEPHQVSDGSNTARSNTSSDTTHSFAEAAVLEMTKALNNRLDPDKETKKMEDENSIATIKAFYVFGDIDWNTGTVLETAEPELSPALLKAFEFKSGSRARVMKRFIETGMEPVGEEDPELFFNSIIQDRDFVFVDTILCSHFLTGNFQRIQADSLTKPASAFDQLSLAPQRGGTGKIALLRQKDLQRNVEKDLDAPDCQREKVDALVERAGCLEKIDDVTSMASNNINWASLVVVPVIPTSPKLKCIFSSCSQRIYCLLKSTEFKDWALNTLSRQPHLYVTFFLKLDAVWVMLAKMALNSNTIEYMKDHKAAKLKQNKYLQQAVRITWLFEKEVNDKISMGYVFGDVPRITPDAHNPDIQASKAQKTAANTSATMSNVTSRNNGNNNGGNGGNKQRTNRKTSAGGLVSTNSNRREPSELGFFVPKPNCTIKKMFGKILEMDKEAQLPCYDWHAKGLVCNRNDCKFAHGVFQNFQSPHRDAILDSMVEHKCATLNRELLKNKRFKACIDEKYNELWNEPAASTTDGQ